MDYSESLREILIKKITKAERDLYQLKLDYCRFVFGINHRSKVNFEDEVYQVKAVNLDSMVRDTTGEWTKPELSCIKLTSKTSVDDVSTSQHDVIELDDRWELSV